MKSFDRKRAASGERGDMEQEMVLAPVESLLAALKAPVAERRCAEENKSHTEPLVPSVERRGVRSLKPLPEMSFQLSELIRLNPASIAKCRSQYLTDEREIIGFVGVSDRTDGLELTMTTLHGEKMSKEPMTQFDSVRVIEKIHPFVYRMGILRDELSVNAVVYELGLYSRVIGTEQMDYLGKAKIFFPRPHNDMVLWINLSNLR